MLKNTENLISFKKVVVRNLKVGKNVSPEVKKILEKNLDRKFEK